MCTVTYLPSASGFILTHNRDEAPARSPKNLERENRAGNTLLFPRDTGAGGTWIAASDNGRLACVLNGAFVKHKHQPPYRRSRGLLLLDFFETPDGDRFFTEHPLDGIEPFTMLWFEEGRVNELRWDGMERHVKNLDPEKTHFWCSATLYPPEMQTIREAVFREWEKENDLSASAILDLHRNGSVDDPFNDFVMNRNNLVRTVSISQIEFGKAGFAFSYYELLSNLDLKENLNVIPVPSTGK